jgi:hypothetical protein
LELKKNQMNRREEGRCVEEEYTKRGGYENEEAKRNEVCDK